LRFVELFAGIGGFSLGFERAGMECVGHVEIEPYAQKVLLKHWPKVKLLPDVTKVKGDEFGKVDLLCGGFPCQPFSNASHGVIKENSMWIEFYRIIKNIKPRVIVIENVLEKAFKEARTQLKDLGYAIGIYRIGADEFGAPHIRTRWWLCAYSNNESKFLGRLNAKMGVLPKLQATVWGKENYTRAIRVPDGLPNRMDRLKCLGNALVPQIAEYIGNQIMETECHIQTQ